MSARSRRGWQADRRAQLAQHPRCQQPGLGGRLCDGPLQVHHVAPRGMGGTRGASGPAGTEKIRNVRAETMLTGLHQVTIRVKISRRFRWRLRIGLSLIGLGVRLTGAAFEIERTENGAGKDGSDG